MDLPERQKLLWDNYHFICQCPSCSELNLSDLVVNSLCCPQSNCLGALSESINYSTKENFVHVSLSESHIYKLSLPVSCIFSICSKPLYWWHHPEFLLVKDVSKVDEDMKKAGKSFFQHSGVSLNIDRGCCMSCGSHLDVSSAVAMSHRLISKISRYDLHNCTS